jgi:hypothetical protein
MQALMIAPFNDHSSEFGGIQGPRFVTPRVPVRLRPDKRPSIEESSRGIFFRIPAAMPTFEDLSDFDE